MLLLMLVVLLRRIDKGNGPAERKFTDRDRYLGCCGGVVGLPVERRLTTEQGIVGAGRHSRPWLSAKIGVAVVVVVVVVFGSI